MSVGVVPGGLIVSHSLQRRKEGRKTHLCPTMARTIPAPAPAMTPFASSSTVEGIVALNIPFLTSPSPPGAERLQAARISSVCSRKLSSNNLSASSRIKCRVDASETRFDLRAKTSRRGVVIRMSVLLFFFGFVVVAARESVFGLAGPLSKKRVVVKRTGEPSSWRDILTDGTVVRLLRRRVAFFGRGLHRRRSLVLLFFCLRLGDASGGFATFLRIHSLLLLLLLRVHPFFTALLVLLLAPALFRRNRHSHAFLTQHGNLPFPRRRGLITAPRPGGEFARLAQDLDREFAGRFDHDCAGSNHLVGIVG